MCAKAITLAMAAVGIVCKRMNELAERLHVMLAVDESVFVLQSINQSQGRIPAREVMAASGAVAQDVMFNQVQ